MRVRVRARARARVLQAVGALVRVRVRARYLQAVGVLRRRGRGRVVRGSDKAARQSRQRSGPQGQ